MRLDDGKPWFRQWLVIGFRPITPEGQLVIEVMAGICVLAGILMFWLVDHPGWAFVVMAVTMPLVLAGYVIIYWKREDNF